VILMSGFSEQDAVASFTGKALAGFLSKSSNLAALGQEVRAAHGFWLNAPGSGRYCARI
jgi:hypothetical protein